MDGPGRRALVADFWRGLLPGGGEARAGHAADRTGLEDGTGAGQYTGAGCQPLTTNTQWRKALNQVQIYTDGACKGNPGPGGWGVVLLSGGTEKELFGGEPATTNNRMELTAVIEALAALKRPCQVSLYLDSEYVRKGITEWVSGWKTRGWRTAAKQPVKNVDLWQRLDALVGTAGHAISWRWVKGHSGNPGNERADMLANRGVELARMP